MIKKIRLLLSWHTFPVWLYNEKDEIIDNEVPPEWLDDKELIDIFDSVSDYYDSLFINNSKEFRFVGFKNMKRKKEFLELVQKAIKTIEIKNNNKYQIVNDFYPHLDQI